MYLILAAKSFVQIFCCHQSLSLYSLLQVFVVEKTIKRKKNTKAVKEELLKSLKLNDTVKESGSDIKNIVDQKETINKIKHYDKITKAGNKNMIRHDSIQGQMYKKFKNSEEFVANFGISSSRIYFKIGP